MVKKVLSVMAVISVVGVGGYAAASRVWGFPLLGVSRTSAEAVNTNEKVSVVSLGQFMTNLADPGRFIRVSVEVEVTSDEAQSLTRRMSELKTDIYALLRSRSFGELSGEEGLRSLQTDMERRLDERCPKTVRHVYFSEFIVQ